MFPHLEKIFLDVSIRRGGDANRAAPYESDALFDREILRVERRCALAVKGHPPDRAPFVVGDEEGAVACDGDVDRAAPDTGVAGHEADKKILIDPCRAAVRHEKPDDLVAGALRPVPRAVEGDERVAPVFGGELSSLVERDPERGRMRLEQRVGNANFSGEIGPLALVARVLVRADVEPWPTVKAALRDTGRIVGRKVVAESVALVDDAPQGAARRLDGQPRAVA